MHPPSIAVALLKVVTLPTHPHPCPCTHRGLIYNTRRRKSIPLSQALQHGWLRKTATPSSVSAPTTKSSSTDCVLKTDGGPRLVKGGVFGRPSRIVANGESRSWVGSWMMLGSGSLQSVVGERDLRRISRKWASGGPDRGGEAGIAEKDEQEPPVMGIIDHQKENGNADETDRSMGINDVNGEHSILDQQSKLLTIPTVLTLGRVAAVPVLITTFYMDGRWATTATTSIFIIASVTDWLDGYIARKMRLGSTFGAFLDPVADKLMVAAALVLLCTKPLEAALFSQLPWLLTLPSIAIIGREITMSAVREWAASQNSGVLEAVAVNNLGKWKTATQMTALTILLASRDSSLASQGILVAAGLTLLNISAALAVWSLAVYMRKIWRVLLK